MSAQAMGIALVRLGELMQDPDASITALATAAHACGLRLEFRLVPAPDDEPLPEDQNVE